MSVQLVQRAGDQVPQAEALVARRHRRRAIGAEGELAVAARVHQIETTAAGELPRLHRTVAVAGDQAPALPREGDVYGLRQRDKRTLPFAGERHETNARA